MFKLEFATDNACFAENPIAEIDRILQTTSLKIENGKYNGIVFDYDGNRIGEYIYD